MKKTAVRIFCTVAVFLLLFGVFTGATVAVSGDKQPFITITKAPEVLVQGEMLVVEGIADGMPQYVQYYIFGTNYFRSDVVSVADGEFTIEVDKEGTTRSNMAAGQYFLVVQHPMYDKIFSIGVVGKNIFLNENGDFKDGSAIINTDELQSANAANALCRALDSQNIDDVYARSSFIVAGPTSYIDAIPSSINKGDILTISGTTTGHKGEVVSVELISTASVVKQTTKISDDGAWSVFFDTSNINAGEYTCYVAVGQLDAISSKVTIVDCLGSDSSEVKYGIDNLVISPNPSDPLYVGDRVTASVEVNLQQGTVDTASRISFDSPLSGDTWIVDIIKAGTIVNTKHPTSPYLYIAGFDLDYDADITLRISVTGSVSSESAGKEISVLKIVKSGVHDKGIQSYESLKQYVYNTGVSTTDVATSTPTAAPTQTYVATPEPTVIPTQTYVVTPEPTVIPTQTYVVTSEPTVIPTQIPTSAPVQTSVPTQQPAQSESSLTSASVSEVASDVFAGIGATPFIVAVALVVLGGVIVLFLRRK